MADHRLRPFASSDAATVDAVLALNERWVPHVGSLTRERLVGILDQAAFAVVAASPSPASDGGARSGRLDGFVIVLGPGADYDSPNYRFFERRSAERRADDGPAPDELRYVDRIAVAPEAQGTGVGRRLYSAAFDHARSVGAVEVTCEVNLEPPNPDSQAFHARLGFVEVGRQWTYDDTVEVQLLARAL